MDEQLEGTALLSVSKERKRNVLRVLGGLFLSHDMLRLSPINSSEVMKKKMTFRPTSS